MARKNLDEITLLYAVLDDSLFIEFIEIFGWDDAMKVIDIFGGTVIRVPSRESIQKTVRDVDVCNRLSGKTGKRRKNEIEKIMIEYDIKSEPGVDFIVKKVQKLLG